MPCGCQKATGPYVKYYEPQPDLDPYRALPPTGDNVSQALWGTYQPYQPTGACDAGDAGLWLLGGLLLGAIGTLVAVNVTGQKTVRGLARKGYHAAKRIL